MDIYEIVDDIDVSNLKNQVKIEIYTEINNFDNNLIPILELITDYKLITRKDFEYISEIYYHGLEDDYKVLITCFCIFSLSYKFNRYLTYILKTNYKIFEILISLYSGLVFDEMIQYDLIDFIKNYNIEMDEIILNNCDESYYDNKTNEIMSVINKFYNYTDILDSKLCKCIDCQHDNNLLKVNPDILVNYIISLKSNIPNLILEISNSDVDKLNTYISHNLYHINSSTYESTRFKPNQFGYKYYNINIYVEIDINKSDTCEIILGYKEYFITYNYSDPFHYVPVFDFYHKIFRLNHLAIIYLNYLLSLYYCDNNYDIKITFYIYIFVLISVEKDIYCKFFNFIECSVENIIIIILNLFAVIIGIITGIYYKDKFYDTHLNHFIYCLFLLTTYIIFEKLMNYIINLLKNSSVNLFIILINVLEIISNIVLVSFPISFSILYPMLHAITVGHKNEIIIHDVPKIPLTWY